MLFKNSARAQQSPIASAAHQSNESQAQIEFTSCPICHNFQPEDFVNHKLRPFTYVPKDSEGRPGFVVDAKVEEMQKSSSNGCNGCSVLYQGYLQCRTLEMASSVDYNELYLAAVFVPGQITKASVYKDAYISHKQREEQVYCTFQIFALTVVDKPNPWGTLLRAPCFPHSILTNERRACFESWIQDCLTNHPACQRTQNFIPKRLIDLGDANGSTSLNLKEGLEQPSPYIALSHSWKFSEAQKASTIRSNLQQRKSLISWDVLSKTFRDAVAVSRWLGIRYLWIDSLCIVQDDPADWAEQAAVMGSIYEGAYVTIAVQYDPSGSPEDGCFLKRKSLHEIVLQDSNGHPFSTFIKSSYEHDLAKPRALASRAWCLQERLLSPRVLHFRQWEVIFECFSNSRCECQAMGFEIEDEYNHRMPEKDASCLLQPHKSVLEMDQEKAWSDWKDIVAAYTASDLTVIKDKLPALSGVVQRMPRQIFGDYVAGLWTEKLVEELLWGHNIYDKFFRPKEYVAPSFSWASVHGGAVRWYMTAAWLQNSRRKAEILETATTPVTNDSMGMVQGGFIRMRTRIFEAKFQLSSGREENIDLVEQFDHTQGYTCEASFDTDNDKKASIEKILFVAEILNHGQGAGFLLLKHSERWPNAFERVGWGYFEASDNSSTLKSHPDDCFYGISEQEVVLV